MRPLGLISGRRCSNRVWWISNSQTSLEHRCCDLTLRLPSCHHSGWKPTWWKKPTMDAPACTLRASPRSSTCWCRRKGEGFASSGRTGWWRRGATDHPRGRRRSLPGSSTSARSPSSAAGGCFCGAHRNSLDFFCPRFLVKKAF